MRYYDYKGKTLQIGDLVRTTQSITVLGMVVAFVARHRQHVVVEWYAESELLRAYGRFGYAPRDLLRLNER